MPQFKLTVQKLIKSLGRSAGLEIRYSFQFPSITDPRIYDRWLNPPDVRCIFDVGANVGQSATKFSEAFPHAVVHSFEPFPASFRSLKILADNSGGRIKAYPVACGDAPGYMQVAVADNPTSQLNSLTTNASTVSSGQTIQIEVKRLDTVCAEAGIETIDLLKTDTEGFDAKVLTGASNLLSTGKIRCVVSEIGFLDDKQHTPFVDMYDILTRHGFKLGGIFEISYLRNFRCDFANALFVKSA